MEYTRLLDGKYALVTNGNDPSGQAIIKKLSDHGANVAFGIKSEEVGQEILASIIEESPESFYFILDLAHSDSIEDFSREVNNRFSFTSILVNNPAGNRPKTIIESDEEDDDFLLQVNQRSIMQTMRALFKAMKDNNEGSIINISSNAVFKPYSGNPFLTLSMGTVGGLTRVPAFEGGEHYVRVNEIFSGIVPGGDSLIDAPLKREGLDVEGLADMVLFLASPMSTYITGQSFSLDGGASRELFPVSLEDRRVRDEL